ncbi:MAG: response regulator [Lachnospiraceae bacterium]|nr:response regulator [Lachnospiraceae bacterium]
MYTVLVAEDEPLALKTICSIIEKHCGEYRIVARAENGSEALRLIRELKPDLIISDIKMPRPNGVELSAIVREELPDICFIIISGYQDFEYTQSAIRSGVTDYLLKPVMPDDLKSSLELAAQRIRRIQYRARNRLLGKLGRGERVDNDEMKRYFPHSRYYGALIRANGLPKRFFIDSRNEVYSDIDEQYIVFGRDELEGLYLIPEEFISGDSLASYMERIGNAQNPGSYYTLIYDGRSFPVSLMQEKVHELYRALDLNSTIGLTQSIDLKDAGREDASLGSDRRELEEVLQRIEALSGAGKLEALRTELKSANENWARKRKPQLWMENFVREVISILRRYDILTVPLNECEYFLGEVFGSALSVDILNDSLLEIFLGEGNTASQKAGSKEYFDQIVKFLDMHIHESISLQDICDRFSISQAYMSKLFRKYTSNSFNKYLTERRMLKARELFEKEPGIYIKDVASMVGYSDQFYFSRIFRTYTGKSPTEYLRELEQF